MCGIHKTWIFGHLKKKKCVNLMKGIVFDFKSNISRAY